LSLFLSQLSPPGLQAPPAELIVTVEFQAVLHQGGLFSPQPLTLFLQRTPLVLDLSLTLAGRHPLGRPVAVETAFQSLPKREYALPLELNLALAVSQLLARLSQIAHDLSRVHLMGGPDLLERGVRRAGLVTKADEPPALLLQMRGELLLLLFQGYALMLQLEFFFRESRLLCRHGGRLDSQRLLLLLQTRRASREAGAGKMHAKLKGPDGEQVAFLQRADRSRLSVYKSTRVDFKTPEHEPGWPESEHTMVGMNRIHVKAQITALRPAHGGYWSGERPARAMEPAILDNQFGRC
jgi:hypothetical protein